MKIRNKNDELLDLVNEKDEVIGTVWKSEAHSNPSKIHREIAIAVFNDKNETLLQQRSLKKSHDPGMWQLTGAGHVGAGENPEKAAKRELYEEVGLVCDHIYVRKEFVKDNTQARFFYIYYGRVSGSQNYKLDQDEVMDVKWIAPNEIDNFAKKIITK